MNADTMTKIDNTAMFKLSYGLYVLSARDGDFDNACIINTTVQVTDSPKRISVTVNKMNFTHDMILRTGAFAVSVISTDAPFSLFQDFGFVSGRDKNKFAGRSDTARSADGIVYIKENTNAFISAKVISTLDLGTHTLFIGEVNEAAVLSDKPTATYEYYLSNIKPKPETSKEPTAKKKYVCKICGYVYEGDELPPDFICPICKHGAEDFELVE